MYLHWSKLININFILFYSINQKSKSWWKLCGRNITAPNFCKTERKNKNENKKFLKYAYYAFPWIFRTRWVNSTCFCGSLCSPPPLPLPQSSPPGRNANLNRKILGHQLSDVTESGRSLWVPWFPYTYSFYVAAVTAEWGLTLTGLLNLKWIHDASLLFPELK